MIKHQLTSIDHHVSIIWPWSSQIELTIESPSSTIIRTTIESPCNHHSTRMYAQKTLKHLSKKKLKKKTFKKKHHHGDPLISQANWFPSAVSELPQLLWLQTGGFFRTAMRLTSARWAPATDLVLRARSPITWRNALARDPKLMNTAWKRRLVGVQYSNIIIYQEKANKCVMLHNDEWWSISNYAVTKFRTNWSIPNC